MPTTENTEAHGKNQRRRALSCCSPITERVATIPLAGMNEMFSFNRVGIAPRVLSVNHRSRAGRCPRG